jgi:hypothetical protein
MSGKAERTVALRHNPHSVLGDSPGAACDRADAARGRGPVAYREVRRARADVIEPVNANSAGPASTATVAAAINQSSQCGEPR